MSAVFFIIAIILFIVLIGFRSSIKSEEKQKLQGAGNKEFYPNFRNALRRVYQERFELYADNGKVVTYKVYTTYLNRKVGETFFILSLSRETNYLRQSYKGYDKTEIITDEYDLQTKADLSIDGYIKILGKLTVEILSDSRFLKSTSGLTF